jgi:hypothetical protein
MALSFNGLDNMGKSSIPTNPSLRGSATPQTTPNGNGGGASGGVMTDVVEQQVTSFVDASPTDVVDIPMSGSSLVEHVVEGKSPLGQFLSRPVKIANHTWSTSDDLDSYHNIQPFRLYFDNANIKYKLHNWAFIRCNLKIKIVFNASPFYYGTFMYSWLPMEGTNYVIDYVLNTDASSHIPLSQLSKVLICPQTHQSVEMTLPFVWPTDFLSVRNAQSFTDMGTLEGRNLALLQSANDAAGDVSLSIYAWAEDVVLYGATSSLAMQGGDEYGTGSVSRPATAIANWASYLGKVPFIGPYATATSIGANAIASIAKLFGYTNVPVIEDHKAVETRCTPFMSVVDTGYPIEKLTMDNKNELSIDPRLVGLSSLDELSIAHLAQKESYLTQFNWTSSNSEDDLLWNSAVRPQMYSSSGDTQFTINMVPMCWLATLFTYWRGDIIFRFKVNCSAFHKGRMRITFDPSGNASTTAATQMSCYTEIVDIAPSTDVEMRIPYQQYISWSKTKLATALTNSDHFYGTSGTNYHTDEYTNGTISVRCQTKLTSPIDESTIQVLVFVRGAENLEFSAPSSNNYRQVIFGGALQAGVEFDDDYDGSNTDPPTELTLGERASPLNELYLTYMGEQILSLRTLMRRISYTMEIPVAINTSTTSNTLAIQLYRIPPRFGFVANGLSTVQKLIPSGNASFNWIQPTPLNTISPCFLGNRGAVNYTVLLNNYATNSMPIAAFRSDVHTTIGSSAASSTSGAGNIAKFSYTGKLATSGGGAANNKVDKTTNISMPYYSAKKFAPNSLTAGTTLSYNENILSDGLRFELDIPTTSNSTFLFKFYTGAGTDFNLVNFLYVPTMTVLTTLPTAV